MTRSRQIFLFALSLACLAVLGFVFRSFLYENIFQPVGLVFWLLWRLIEAVPQSFYWGAVILICAFLVIRMLPRGVPEEPISAEDPFGKVENSYYAWLSAFAYGSADLNGLNQLREKLKRLALQASGRNEKFNTNFAEELFHSERETLPEKARAFLFPEESRPSLAERLRLRSALFFASFHEAKNREMPDIIHQPIDEILTNLEEQAEIPHEH